MSVMVNSQTAARVMILVSAMLEKRSAGKSVTPSQNLRDAGLTSLDLVNLMLAIEAHFDIFIPQDQMTPENFASVSAISSLVVGLTSGT